MRKFFGGIALAMGLLAMLSASAFAGDAVAPQSQTTSASKNYLTTTSRMRAAPLMQLAACLPQGSSCSKGGDCCSGNCDPKHNKCAR
jgi:hypothetical protein